MDKISKVLVWEELVTIPTYGTALSVYESIRTL